MVEQWIKDANNAIRISAEIAYDELVSEAHKQNIELDYAIEVFRREFNRIVNSNNR